MPTSSNAALAVPPVPVIEDKPEAPAETKIAPVTERKRTGSRAGKQIGSAAAIKKAKAEAQSAKLVKKAEREATKTERGRAPRYPEETPIHLLVESNPGREGSKPYRVFELFKANRTVGAFRAKAIKAGLVIDGYGTMAHFVRRGLIKIGGAAPAQPKPTPKAPAQAGSSGGNRAKRAAKRTAHK
jgi:hypothetical protein